MSGAERVPSVLVSAMIDGHDKIIGLPNDRARWGWIVTLSRAKLRRPPGEFGSRAVVVHVLGYYARFIDDYLVAGLLHVAPFDCAGCFAKAPQWRDLRAGTVVVHDWHCHQRTSSQRVADWRAERGITSGHVTLGETVGQPSGNLGETSGKPFPSGALSQSLSLSRSLGGTGGAGGEEPEPERPALIWLAQHRATLDPNGNGLHRKLAALVEHHGLGPVVATFEELSVDPETHTARQFVLGAVNRLDRIPAAPSAKEAEAAEREAEREQARRNRKPDPLLAEITASIAEKHGDGERYVPGRSEQSA